MSKKVSNRNLKKKLGDLKLISLTTGSDKTRSIELSIIDSLRNNTDGLIYVITRLINHTYF